ncbi:hypothetical protein ABZ341_40380 [Streptomyces sp. NPDC006173]|uniref:hypothetical protein n=1 Tax=Streptomyces sp. NPDC006173 TaxID=3155349 RepID=UPI0033E4DF39
MDQAARVADKLVDNAVRHGLATPDGLIVLRLIILEETQELLIEVDDALPGFPDFETAANQPTEPIGTPTGLWWVAHYHAELIWDVRRDQDGVVIGKTVQAILPASWEGSE